MYSRATTTGAYGTLLSSLQNSLANLQNLQKQMSTQNKYLSLTENPSATARGLLLDSSLTANTQYQTNSKNAVTMLKYAEGALNTVLGAAESIRTLVVQAGDPALGESELQDVADQIAANRDVILDALNTKVAGQYLFGGTDTGTKPFTTDADGNIVYNGSDERIQYALGDGLLGDVSFTGGEIVPSNDTSHFICSHYVSTDWQWTGREEKVQITVGNRTLAVFIPEQWIDEVTTTGVNNATDNNQFRDPGEVSGITLDDLATLINRSLTEQGASMLVTASVDKNLDTGQQQLIVKSLTGEKIGITGWTDTDYMPMPQTLTSLSSFSLPSGGWDDQAAEYSGITGAANLLSPSWAGTAGQSITISLADSGGTVTRTADIDISGMTSASALVDAINEKFAVASGELPFASLVNGRLTLQSTQGTITVEDTTGATTGGAAALLGADTVTGTRSSLAITVGNDTENTVRIYANVGDELSDLAKKINAIEGVYSRTSVDGDQLVVVAQRTGSQPDDYLSVNEAEESAHYPSLVIAGAGVAASLFASGTDVVTASDTGYVSSTVGSKLETRPVDHSHMDVFDVLGMETGIKSREFLASETLSVDAGTELKWQISSGGHTQTITMNAGDYTLSQIAERLNNACSGWLEVTVDVVNPAGTNQDAAETGLATSLNSEAATQRLVIRGLNGEQVILLDMNDQRYAEQVGISTVLRTDADTGMDTIYFPSAPCVDDSLGVKMRVQMDCGMSYDVNITRSAVTDSASGLVDRTLVMKEIVRQVNAQESEPVMGVAYPDGDEAASIYFLSGEPFTVVDLPFSDPEWNDYSGGLAAQMGIHGGITANLAKTDNPMKDNAAFGTTGTIRFENLGRSVEIDVAADDTVKSVMDKLRNQAGDWLYVNYYDTHMGQDDTRNTGDYPIIAISSVDGSAVNVVDVTGTIAEKNLGLSTGVQGTTAVASYDSDGKLDTTSSLTWAKGALRTFSITVAGYTHNIDMGAMLDTNGNGTMDIEDLVATINARMQDDDLRAELNDDGKLILYSPRGYAFSAQVTTVDANGDPATSAGDLTATFFGGSATASNYYRGGYKLSESASGTDRNAYAGVYSQNVTTRSGANTTTQNAFGMLDDVIAAVKAGNRDELGNKMIPRIDAFIDSILSVMSTDGALVNRYNNNIDRLVDENLIMTEEYDNLVKIDPTEIATQMLMASYLYQANLSVISQLIQPSLLDYLS